MASGCDGCNRFAQRIAELEQRIATLYQIQELETDIDVFLGKTLTAANSMQLADTLVCSPDESEKGLPHTFPDEPVEFVGHAALTTDEGPWILQGAKPKQFSTPTTQPSHRLNHCAEKQLQDLSFGLTLTNRYSLLDEEFPPLRREPPSQASFGSHRCGNTAPPAHGGDSALPRRFPGARRGLGAGPDGTRRGPHASRTGNGSAKSARRRLLEEAVLRSQRMSSRMPSPPTSVRHMENGTVDDARRSSGGTAEELGDVPPLDRPGGTAIYGASCSCSRCRHIMPSRCPCMGY